jgi:hypothetical protein
MIKLILNHSYFHETLQIMKDICNLPLKIVSFFFFVAVLGFELRALCLLSRYSTA